MLRHRLMYHCLLFEEVAADPVLYAHANRILHLETNPGNARAMVQKHGERDVWLNAPPIPLTTEEMGYCENDIVIITAYISEQIAMYKDITKIPATNTGRVRKHVKDECYFF